MGARKGNKLEKWEISLVKTLLSQGYVPQDIQAYFSRPTRSINHARISEIRDGVKHKQVKPASAEEIDRFLYSYPNTDPNTGLDLKGDELIIKAREAMIAAVLTFNGAAINFRSELFIVSSVIAWTYLLHAYYKKEGVDYRHKKNGVVLLTPGGAEKYWELSQCLRSEKCPIDEHAKLNLTFLLEIRHEIEHRSTDRIDDAIGAKLQACCLNFNDTIKNLFGRQYSLEKRLPIALQFVTFDFSQSEELKRRNLSPHISTTIDKFHETLTEEQRRNPKFRHRVVLVPISNNNPNTADHAVEILPLGSERAAAAEEFLVKEVEREKLRPMEVVRVVKKAGYTTFSITDHTDLVRQLNAKNEGKGFGVTISKQWYWYQVWVEKILEKLEEGWTR